MAQDTRLDTEHIATIQNLIGLIDRTLYAALKNKNPTSQALDEAILYSVANSYPNIAKDVVRHYTVVALNRMLRDNTLRLYAVMEEGDTLKVRLTLV